MIEEKVIVGENSQYPLNGMLTLPDKLDTPVPAVVFVHGSGTSNMDEKVYKIAPFKDLAEGFASYGIASIRYDKRAYKHAMKMMKEKDGITVKNEVIEDAIKAADMLRNDDRIDHDCIFIVGHSMGGMLAPRIDEEGGNFKGLIILAGTPRKLEEVMKEQLTQTLDAMNPVLKFLASGSIKKMMNQFDGLYELSDEKAKKTKFGNGVTLYYFKEMGSFDTKTYFDTVNKPILIMQGDKDFQVSVEKDFHTYKEMLKDYENVTFKLYEGLNHCFMPSIYGTLSKAKQEYSVAQHVNKDVIKDIAEFILKA